MVLQFTKSQNIYIFLALLWRYTHTGICRLTMMWTHYWTSISDLFTFCLLVGPVWPTLIDAWTYACHDCAQYLYMWCGWPLCLDLSLSMTGHKDTSHPHGIKALRFLSEIWRNSAVQQASFFPHVERKNSEELIFDSNLIWDQPVEEINYHTKQLTCRQQSGTGTDMPNLSLIPTFSPPEVHN